MKLGLVQYNPSWENKTKNQKKILQLIESQQTNFDLLIFPEMTLTGYTMNSELGENFDSAESPTLKFFIELSKKFGVNIIAGMIEKEGTQSFNTLFLIDKLGEIKTKYRKIHLFSFAVEEKFYQAGSKPAIVLIDDFKVGLSICYDLRFPELFRPYGKERVDLIVNIANWPDSRIEHFVHLLRARSIENLCYVAGVNRVGSVGKLRYDGQSSIFDPLGKIIVSEKNSEKIIFAEIDKELVKKTRDQFPFLNDIKLI